MRLFKKEKIESFEIVTLHTSGMRYVNDYEIVSKSGTAEVSRYGIIFEQNQRTRVLEKRAVCSEETVLKLLNDCSLLSWDGFVGRHPRGIKDGIMFTLDATVNGGKQIHASGSQNFPRRYRKFNDGIYELLNSGKRD